MEQENKRTAGLTGIMLMFFSKLHRMDNIVLQTLMRVLMVKYEMLSLAVKYGLNDVRRDCLLLRMLYGHALYRKFSCNVYYVSTD